MGNGISCLFNRGVFVCVCWNNTYSVGRFWFWHVLRWEYLRVFVVGNSLQCEGQGRTVETSRRVTEGMRTWFHRPLPSIRRRYLALLHGIVGYARFVKLSAEAAAALQSEMIFTFEIKTEQYRLLCKGFLRFLFVFFFSILFCFAFFRYTFSVVDAERCTKLVHLVKRYRSGDVDLPLPLPLPL